MKPRDGLSAAHITDHLYNAFLEGRTPDVTVKVKGAAWAGLYRLHKVVVIQSGFFQGLFTKGFAESSNVAEIDVVFDDRNITRAGVLDFISFLFLILIKCYSV